jgi:putative salt-induced outer membrane protein
MQIQTDFARFARASRQAALIGVIALGGALPAHADWVGKGEGGLLLSRGNAEATSLNAKLDVAREDGPWKNIVFLGGLYGKNATHATAQRMEGRYELDHKINDRLYGFLGARAERDLFSGFDYQATLSAGLGYKFIDTDTTKLSGTLGVGYRRLRPELLIKDGAGAVIDRLKLAATGNAVGTAGLNFEHKLTASTKVTDKLLIESGSTNTSVANDLGLQVSMSERLALSVGYGVRFNSDPSAGTKRTDQVTTVNIVYAIK